MKSVIRLFAVLPVMMLLLNHCDRMTRSFDYRTSLDFDPSTHRFSGKTEMI